MSTEDTKAQRCLRLILFAFCLVCASSVWGQSYLFHNVSVRSGLPGNFVQSIGSDRRGFIWLATYNGLVRYDGYDCQSYPVSERGTGNATYQDLRRDASGRLWMTLNGKPYFYDEAGDRIVGDPMLALRPLGVGRRPQRVVVDGTGNLWLVDGHALGHYDFARRRLTWLRLPVAKSLVTLQAVGDEAFLLYADRSLYRLDVRRHHLRRIAILPMGYGAPTQLFPDGRRLWGYVPHGQGLFCLDSLTGRALPFPGDDIVGGTLITCLASDGHGAVWIGTDNQGIVVSRRDGYQWLRADPQDAFTLPDDHVQSLYRSPSGLLWVGTSKGGASFTTLRPSVFTRHTVPGHGDVACFAFPGGGVAMGFDGNGMALWNPTTDAYQFLSQADGLPSNVVVGSRVDSHGQLWMGTYGGGVFSLNGTHVTTPSGMRDYGGLRYVRSMVEDGQGALWLGSFTDGLYCYRDGRVVAHLTVASARLPSNVIRSLSCRDGHTLFVSTSAGMAIVDTRTHRTTPPSRYDARMRRLDSLLVKAICQTGVGTLAIGTHHGLLLFPKGRAAVTLTSDDGLSNDDICGIAADRYGTLWVTTVDGLTRVVADPQQAKGYRCQAYYADDGLGGIRFNLLSIACAPDGRLYAGGSTGFVEIRPDRPSTDHEGGRVVFCSLVMGSQAGDDGHGGRSRSDNSRSLSDDDRIEVAHDDNFTITVSSLDYAALRKNHYLYRLDSDGAWVRLGGNRIQLDHLAPGTYSLQVRTTLSPSVSTLTIHVRPPFYLSLPAIVVYVLALVAMVVWLYRRNIARQRRALEAKARVRDEERRRKLDDDRIRFFTNVSHDLRTPLSLILIPLEQMRKQSLTTSLRDQLDLVYRNACLLRDDIRQILDFNRLGSGEMRLAPTRGDLTAFLAACCDRFRPRADLAGLVLTWHSDVAGLWMDFDHAKVERILFNLLANAVKYNTPKGSIDVSLSVNAGSPRHMARLRVADTGIGIKDENRQRVFRRFFQEQHDDASYTGIGIGLNIVEEYVRLMGGSVAVTDNEPRGTVFTVSLPVIAADEGPAMEDVPSLPAGKAVTADEKGVADSRPHILLVDDNDDFRSFLSTSMADKYRVSQAANGREALDVLHRDDILLVVSDVMMPVMDGLALCRRIKSDMDTSHIPVILLTARTTDEQQLEGLHTGADDYIAKPFNLDILEARIDRIIEWTRESHRRFRQVEVEPSEITVTHLDEEFIAKAIKIVEEHIGDSQFTVEELGQQVGLTRGHLYKKLMAIVGMPPVDFIRTLRIKRGKQMVEQSDMNISQIAYAVGLSPKNFAKYFKEAYGKTPTEYRGVRS